MLKWWRIFRAETKRHASEAATRYFFRWIRSLREGASSVKDEQPWITFKAIDYLKRHLNKTHRVFEYGGGGSTLFFLNHVSEVVTVEHSEEWFAVLKKTIGDRRSAKWSGQFVAAQLGDLVALPDIADPTHYSSDDQPSKGLNYRAYASAIDSFPDAYFDCVVVDGRSRPACIVHALPKIKTGGYLVLDNSDRAYYLSKTAAAIDKNFVTVVNGFAPSPYLTEFTKTTIWKKTK